MRESIRNRVIGTAEYIVKYGATVREAAKVVDVSKSTVHTDMTIRLAEIDREMHKKVKAILEKNREERHIRGGEKTKEKYSKMRQ